jgi:hypothetical protein
MPKKAHAAIKLPKPPEKLPPPPQWRNRIVGHDVVPADDLLANPQNWRIHPKNQQVAVEGILDEVGWCDEVKVNKNTGFVVDGHMRAASAISKGEMVPVAYLDLTPEEEALVLASFNPISSMAVPDEEALNSLIETLTVENADVATFLDGLYAEVNDGALKSASLESPPEAAERDTSRGAMGKPKYQIKAVLYSQQITPFEEALKATGLANRGEAVILICKEYLDHHEKRQLDALEEIVTES